MQSDNKQADSLSSDVQDVMRSLVSAIRSVKLYPPNNPVYSQSVAKAFKELDTYLATAPDFSISVNKTYFAFRRNPVGKDGELNKAIAQDLFAKGVREMIFISGMKETELLELCRALALSPEGMALKNGIVSILWEKGAEHIKVTEAGLDEVISSQEERDRASKNLPPPSPESEAASAASRKKVFSGRTLVLGELLDDPTGFGASMVDLAKQTRGANESVEDRLFTLYQDAGRKIDEENPDESETLFQGLAKSALTIESPLREGLIAGKLYGDLDAEMTAKEDVKKEEVLPSPLQEIQTGRFSSAWNTQQVSTLLKKAAAKKAAPPAPPSVSRANIPVIPLPANLGETAKQLAEYSAEEMAELEAVSHLGMESDIIDSSVRILLSLLNMVKTTDQPGATDKELEYFSGVVHQLEDLLIYLLKKKDFDFAGRIIEAFHRPVNPAFQPRMMEALKKTAPKNIIVMAIEDLRKQPKDSAAYQSAYAYVSALSAQALVFILELLATEEDKTKRIFLLELAKDIGSKHIALLGEHLSDHRWYFVRNIVSILGECRTDHALAMLRKAADHDNLRIREEVIKSLVSIGGKKAAAVMAKFLRDKDEAIQKMAIQSFTELPGIVAEEAVPLMTFLEDRPLTRRDHELTLEAIRALGLIGGRDASLFLKKYEHRRWWKSRKLQQELNEAAQQAMDMIKGRGKNDRREKS